MRHGIHRVCGGTDYDQMSRGVTDLGEIQPV